MELREKLSISRDATVFLYVGRLVKGKGIDVLLDAFIEVHRKIHDSVILFVGDGPLAADIGEAAERAGVAAVKRLGFVEGEDLAKTYGISDVFVFPSLGDPFGLVVAEAAASGLPIITTDRVGAAFDLVEDGRNGVIVPAGSARDLANAMAAVALTEPKRKESMSQCSMTLASRWTHREASLGFERAVRAALDRPSGVASR